MAPKLNYSKSGKQARRANERKTEALERNKDWQSLSPKQQLANLDQRGLTATRQRQRINVAIQASKGK